MERHDFDLISFLFGLLFAGLGAAWLITEESIDPDLAGWFWPLVLIIGGAVVLGSVVSPRRARGDTEHGGSDQPDQSDRPVSYRSGDTD